MLALALLVVLLGLIALLRRRRPGLDGWLANALRAPQPYADPGAGPADRLAKRLEQLAPALGLLLLFAALGALELRQPYYFSQDDERVGAVPAILVGCRSVWHGHFPDYQPWTMLGTPLAALSSASLTYPPTYLAYAIARHALRDEYAVMEVFAWMHLGVGFWLTQRLLRRLGVSGVLAALCGLSFALSGAALTMGRSWHMFTAAIAWIPALVGLALRLREGPVGARWAVLAALAIGVSHHVGFPQLWLYEVGCFVGVVAWLVATAAIPWQRAGWAVVALVGGAAIALPLLWVVVDTTRDMQRAGGYGNGIGEGLGSMLVPVPLVRSAHPNGWGGSEAAWIGTLYYVGAGVLGAAALALVALFTRRPTRAEASRAGFAVLALVAFVLALGPATPLGTLFTKLPLVSILSSHPFRLLPVVVFFACVAAGLAFAALASRSARPRVFELAAAVVVLLPLGVHVYAARAAFYDYGFPLFDPLPPAVAERVASADPIDRRRVMPLAPSRSADTSYAHALEHQLPLVYGVASVGGYDVLSETRAPERAARTLLMEQPTAALRAWGVRWIVVHRTMTKPVFTTRTFQLEHQVTWLQAWQGLDKTQLQAGPATDELQLVELLGSRALAHWKEPTGEQRPLPIRLSDWDAEVELPGDPAPRDVTIALLRWPQSVVLADGVSIPIDADRFGRIVAHAPAGARHLVVGYRAPWLGGLGRGALVALLAVALGALARWLERRGEVRSPVGPVAAGERAGA